MMIVAIIMRPWIVQMLQCGVQPRILADDLLILSADGKESGSVEGATLNRTPAHSCEVGGSVEGATLDRTGEASHIQKLQEVFDKTHKHLQDMGARIAPVSTASPQFSPSR